jgi:hypothetical protein
MRCVEVFMPEELQEELCFNQMGCSSRGSS